MTPRTPITFSTLSFRAQRLDSLANRIVQSRNLLFSRASALPVWRGHSCPRTEGPRSAEMLPYHATHDVISKPRAFSGAARDLARIVNGRVVQTLLSAVIHNDGVIPKARVLSSGPRNLARTTTALTNSSFRAKRSDSLANRIVQSRNLLFPRIGTTRVVRTLLSANRRSPLR